ncbi:MAG: NotI family restriction endonuclease [Phycisphaerales bacterium]
MAKDPERPRYGIAEWYGMSYLGLSPAERLRCAKAALKNVRPLPCPFQAGLPPCSKAGGVCSIRQYHGNDGQLIATDAGTKAICITCPQRFRQNNMIYQWIGHELLGTKDVVNLGEIPFLERVGMADKEQPADGDEVGRIDNILAVRGSRPLAWCAVETQAVYFSGKGMIADFKATSKLNGSTIRPLHIRRPDFRSSGPKRLMPQLQIKVPTLSRWGKKTAVVVDQAFFDAMGRMRKEADKSNADVAWFIVACDGASPIGTLVPQSVSFTTLASAVEGLTAGKPVTQQIFESRILDRLTRLA